jgi:hypothetical protein
LHSPAATPVFLEIKLKRRVEKLALRWMKKATCKTRINIFLKLRIGDNFVGQE